MRDGYFAVLAGVEYEASSDGRMIRLYCDTPVEGFEQIGPDRYRRVVTPAELDRMVYVCTVGTWHGEPVKLLGVQDDLVLVEYLGGRAPVARDLGLAMVDRGVYQAWVPVAQVADVHERVL